MIVNQMIVTSSFKLTRDEAKALYNFLQNLYEFEVNINAYNGTVVDEEDLLSVLYDKLNLVQRNFEDENFEFTFDLMDYYES